jgi:hypothetical protein
MPVWLAEDQQKLGDPVEILHEINQQPTIKKIAVSSYWV